MANLLNDYRQKQEEIRVQISEGGFPANSLLVMQELHYRIFVLETLQSFCKSAPVTMDLQEISIHYQVMLAYMRALVKEHTLGMKADEDLKKKRETAKENLELILQDGCRQFQSFQMTVPDQYKRSVSGMINTVLPAWIQYRNTFVIL